MCYISQKLIRYMYLKLFEKIISDSTPEQKWFLLMLMREFESCAQVRLTVAEFSIRLGVSKDVVTSSCKYLSDKGALRQSRVKTENNGFLNAYDILVTEESIQKIFPSKQQSKIPTCKKHHNNLIELLVTAQSNEFYIPKLKLANRLLLSVLLSYADECGVVRGIGISDLMKLTGMSKDRLDSQVDKLLKQGYVRSKFSGVTGTSLFGIAKGYYYLNLSHRTFKVKQESTKVLFNFEHPERDIDDGPLEAEKIYKAAFLVNKRIRQGYNVEDTIIVNECAKLPCANWEQGLNSYKEFNRFAGYMGFLDFYQIVNFFTDKANIRNYLQNKIYDYASSFLSEHWGNLSGLEKDCCHKLFSRIESEVFPLKYSKNLSEFNFPTSEQKRLLAVFIYNVALGLAQRLWCLLQKVEQNTFKNMACVILPVTEQAPWRQFLTIEFFPVSGEMNQMPSVIRVTKAHEIRTSLLENEPELTDEEKYKFGLLTRPKQKVDNWPK